MKIAGIVKTSLIDYLGKAATVIFLGGCNFRCGYCHNPEIVRLGGGCGAGEGAIEVADFLAFLDSRKRFLDAVCVSGGEPTLYPDLPALLREIRRRGLAVKLDTNGSRPQVLAALVAEGLADYVAMDVKGPLALYDSIAGVAGQGAAVLESAALLAASGVDHEFRTTVCRELLTEAALLQMRREFPAPRRWFLQTFRNPGEILDNAGAYSAYSPAEMAALAAALDAGLR